MAIYTIIGGDGKNTARSRRTTCGKWIAEGRLNAQSLVKGGQRRGISSRYFPRIRRRVRAL
jgi:hypothetical protein